MSDILKRPGWNNILEEKAGRKHTKKLNSAISDLVDRTSLGSNPAQKIQRIANALHKHYADKTFSNKEIVEFIKTKLPSVKLRDENYQDSQQPEQYTADNEWNSRYIEPTESDDSQENFDHGNEIPQFTDQSVNDSGVEHREVSYAESHKPNQSDINKLLKESYYKRLHHLHRMEEKFRRY